MAQDSGSVPAVPWLALAVGVTNLLGLLFLIIMFMVGDPFGPMNDVCNALGGLLSLALAVALFPQHQARSPQLAVPALILALVGAAFTVWGSRLVMTGATGFFLAGMYGMTGYALIGLWLLALNYAALWPRRLVTFGLIAGAVMALGLATIPSIFMRIDTFADARWHTWLGNAGFYGWALLYPIWCLRLWRALRAA